MAADVGNVQILLLHRVIRLAQVKNLNNLFISQRLNSALLDAPGSGNSGEHCNINVPLVAGSKYQGVG